MKKIILFLTIVFFICFNLIYFKYFSLQKENSCLYKNNVEVSIIYNNTVNLDTFIKKLKYYSQNYKLNVSQYIYLNDSTLNIYSTSIQYDNNIKLQYGELPNENSDEYVSNESSNNDNNNVGKIEFPKSDLKVKCYNFDQIKNVGLGNKFIISCNNSDSISKIIDFFNENGQTKILPNLTTDGVNVNFALMPFLLTLLLIAAFSLIISIAYYIVKNKYKFSLQNIFGYNILQIYYKILISILLVIFGGGFITNSIVSLCFYINSKSNYIFEFYLQSNMFLLISLFAIAIFIIGCTFFINRNINALPILKGEKITTQLDIIVLISKIFVSLIIFFITNSFFNQYSNMQNKLNNINYWDKTKNIYKTTLSDQGQNSSSALEREYNNKLYSLYEDLKANKNAFIIDSSGYIVLDEKNGDVTYAYSMAMKKNHKEYDTDAKSIVIDEGYLNVNPIESVDNTSIKTKLNLNVNVINILVPEKYKNVEQDIYNIYLNHFYFQKVTVDNYYNEELHSPLNTLSKSDLDVNIIYVKNNQKYFTYSNDAGSENDHHYITDPICIIYDGKVDTSYIGAYVSDNLYFFDDSQGQTYQNILPYLNNSKTNQLVQSVNSVYKDVNKEINTLNEMNRSILFAIVSLALISFVFSTTYIRLYYQNNLYKLYLKKIMGYSFINIYGKLICLILAINMISSILFSIYFKNIILIFVGLLAIIIEFIIVIISTYYLNDQNINKIIKGEK